MAHPFPSIEVIYQGKTIHVFPACVADAAHTGLTPIQYQILALAGDRLGMSIGELITSALAAEGIHDRPMDEIERNFVLSSAWCHVADAHDLLNARVRARRAR
jgi:hypothetical protein